MEKTLGGDRLGSGKKMKVHLHGYERSTHDLGYLWRSTMSAGTLVPFMSEVALPGDTFDINLNCDIKTHPTIGPLFGSYKVQLDVFQCPIRLYNAMLHNNMLGIGLDMTRVKLPQIRLTATPFVAAPESLSDIDNAQINPSSLLAYLGIRGIGSSGFGDVTGRDRDFNAIPYIAYWDIYKNYYSNKQEDNAYVIRTEIPAAETAVITGVTGVSTFGDALTVPLAPLSEFTDFGGYSIASITIDTDIAVTGTYLDYVLLYRGENQTDAIPVSALDIVSTTIGATDITVTFKANALKVYNYSVFGASQPIEVKPRLEPFLLTNIDDMRTEILGHTGATPAIIPTTIGNYEPFWRTGFNTALLYSQEGLGIKTYQSDLFNNWLSTEWIDGVDGINSITAVDTSGGSFTIDTLQLSKKVYDMLNRIAVSGGSYDDWIDAVYTHDRYTKAESPIYQGGLIKELIFQEVVSNAAATDESISQPLGTLAGKGTMSGKNKGGKIVIHVDEPSYIIGIISLTPRIDFSQGNKWDTHLETMNDLHKPGLDAIGFQELITEQLAWWDTYYDVTADEWVTKSAGKQPAWINYMTNVNQVRGNFAIAQNEMFMTLNRRYEAQNYTDVVELPEIKDLTTYIDPSKYNFIFANTALDAQNFWAQISVNIEARRKMSAKVMPNL